MKNVVLISSLYRRDGPGSGTFEVYFRNLAAGLNGSAERAGLKAQVIPRSESRRPVSAVDAAFAAPSFVSGNFRSALARFKRSMDIEAFIRAYSAELAAYSGLISGADIVHAHDTLSALAYGKVRNNAAAKLCFTPGYLSGLDRSGPVWPWLRKAEAQALGLADFLMVPGRGYLAALDKAYGPLTKSHVVLPGLDDVMHLRTGVLRRRLGVPDSALLAVSFYGPGDSSDAEFFLDAFAAARSRVPDRLFGLISGLKTSDIADKIKALALEDRVVLLEIDAHRWDVLAEADILFSAFRSQSADLGAIEAFRAGVAVVAADDGWNAEAAGYGEAALLFKSGDAAAASAALAEIAGQPPALIYFSAKAREYFKTQYTLEALSVRAADAYSEMAGEPVQAGQRMRGCRNKGLCRSDGQSAGQGSK